MDVYATAFAVCRKGDHDEHGAVFRYGKPGLRDGPFVAWGRAPLT